MCSSDLNHQYKFSRRDRGSSYRVGADSQGFDEGEGVEAQAAAMDEGGAWYGKIFHHTAIDVDAADFYRRAAIGLPVAAGDALSAIKIRDDGYGLAGLETRRLIEIDEIAGQLMTQDTGIFEIGLCSFESMQVGTADADAPDLNNTMARPRQGRISLAVFELAGFYAD